MLSNTGNFLVAAILCPFAGALAKDETTVTVGYAPGTVLVTRDSADVLSGYAYEYLCEIAKLNNWSCTFTEYDATQAAGLLSSGAVDIFLAPDAILGSSCEYSEFPLGRAYVTLFAGESTNPLKYNDFEAWRNISIAMLGSSAYENALRTYASENKFTYIANTVSSNSALANALDNRVSQAALASSFAYMPSKRIISQFAPYDVYFAVAKDAHSVLDGINSAMAQLRTIRPNYEYELEQRYIYSSVNTMPELTVAEQSYIKAAERINVVYEKDLSPICFYADNSIAGIAGDVFKSIAATTGLRFNYIEALSHTEALEMMRTGKATLLAVALYDHDIAKQSGMTVSAPYFTLPLAVVKSESRAGNLIETYSTTALYPNADLTRIGANNAERNIYETQTIAMSALTSGDVDAMLTDSFIAKQLLNDAQYRLYNAQILPGRTHEISIGISNSADPRLVSAIDKALSYVRTEQLYQIVTDNLPIDTSKSLLNLVYKNPLIFVIAVTGVFTAIIVMIARMSSREKKYTKERYKLLYDDAVTGAGNLNKFKADAEKLLAKKGAPQFALFYVDIKQFRYLNDTYGFAEGDRILKELCAALKRVAGEDGAYCRMHSDHFLALTPYEGPEEFATQLEVNKTRLSYFAHMVCRGCIVAVDVGIYVMPEGMTSLSLAIDRANYARTPGNDMHANTFNFYSDSVRFRINEEKTITDDMERAMDDGEFVPYFQPKVNMRTKLIVGAEALTRWVKADGVIVPTYKFINLFEKNGFILKVDFCIFDCACKFLREWMDEGLAVKPIAVNFSGLHFGDPSFAASLREIADNYRVPPNLLEIEMTESAQHEGETMLKRQVKALKAEGFMVTLDDFGAGFSSIGILQTLPADYLKLDKSFLENVGANEREGAMIKAVVEIAESLNMVPVCEGVESEEQMELLIGLNCIYAQGYYFYKPMPKEEYHQLLSSAVEEAAADEAREITSQIELEAQQRAQARIDAFNRVKEMLAAKGAAASPEAAAQFAAALAARKAAADTGTSTLNPYKPKINVSEGLGKKAGAPVSTPANSAPASSAPQQPAAAVPLKDTAKPSATYERIKMTPELMRAQARPQPEMQRKPSVSKPSSVTPANRAMPSSAQTSAQRAAQDASKAAESVSSSQLIKHPNEASRPAIIRSPEQRYAEDKVEQLRYAMQKQLDRVPIGPFIESYMNSFANKLIAADSSFSRDSIAGLAAITEAMLNASEQLTKELTISSASLVSEQFENEFKLENNNELNSRNKAMTRLHLEQQSKIIIDELRNTFRNMPQEQLLNKLISLHKAAPQSDQGIFASSISHKPIELYAQQLATKLFDPALAASMGAKKKDSMSEMHDQAVTARIATIIANKVGDMLMDRLKK